MDMKLDCQMRLGKGENVNKLVIDLDVGWTTMGGWQKKEIRGEVS